MPTVESEVIVIQKRLKKPLTLLVPAHESLFATLIDGKAVYILDHYEVERFVENFEESEVVEIEGGKQYTVKALKHPLLIDYLEAKRKRITVSFRTVTTA